MKSMNSLSIGHFGTFAKTALFISIGASLALSLALAPSFVKASGATLYVDASQTEVGDGSEENPFATIQEAITASVDGDTINVAAGEYVENVSVNKAITLVGAGSSNTKIIATSGNSNPLTFSGDNATVKGFTITHEYTPEELSDWNFNNNTVTFAQGTTGNVLEYSVVTLGRNGIYINNAQGNTLKNNTIENNRTGINLTNNYNNTEIVGNIIRDNWTIGLVTYSFGSFSTNLSTVTVENNTFDNNWYTEVLIKDASNFTGTLDVTNNTFTDSPVTYTTSSDSSLNEPGFADLKPNVPGITGGTATKPVKDLPTLRIYNSGAVMLAYEGKTLLVGADETYTTIQQAIDAASEGDIVSVASGDYTENIIITKNLSLVGAGIGETNITAGNVGEVGEENTAINVKANGVSISNLSLVGGTRGILTQANIEDLTIDAVEASGFSSGIYFNPGAKASISNYRASNNSAGIGSSGVAEVRVTDSLFMDNGEGIGSDTVHENGLAVTGSSFINNTAQIAYYTGGTGVIDARGNYWAGDVPEDDNILVDPFSAAAGTLTLSSSAITAGGSATLSWTSFPGVTLIVVDGVTESSSGSKTVSPSGVGTHDYTAVFTDASGVESSVTVTLTVSGGAGGGGGSSGGGSGSSTTTTPPATTETTTTTTTTETTTATTETTSSEDEGEVLGATTYNFTVSFGQGSSGEMVTELQNLLTSLGFYSGPVTGYFGPLTLEAVKKFQAANGIVDTGFVGELTLAALNESSGETTTPTFTGTLSTEQRTAILITLTDILAQIQAIQARLNQLQAQGL